MKSAMAPKKDLTQLVRQQCICLKRTCFSQFAHRIQEVEAKRQEFNALPDAKKDGFFRYLFLVN